MKAVARIVRSARDDAPRAWYRRKKQSDAFALLTRGAAEAYAHVWTDVFADNGCERLGLGAAAPDDARLRRVCAPLGIHAKHGTECAVSVALAGRGVLLKAE